MLALALADVVDPELDATVVEGRVLQLLRGRSANCGRLVVEPVAVGIVPVGADRAVAEIFTLDQVTLERLLDLPDRLRCRSADLVQLGEHAGRRVAVLRDDGSSGGEHRIVDAQRAAEIVVLETDVVGGAVDDRVDGADQAPVACLGGVFVRIADVLAGRVLRGRR